MSEQLGRLSNVAAYECQPTDTPGFVLVGPSGVGKSTLRDELCQDQVREHNFVKYAPLTTRAPREGEAESGEYRFVDQDTMAHLSSSTIALFGNQSYGNDFLTLWPKRLPAYNYYAYIYLPEAALKLKSYFPNTRIIQVQPGDPSVLSKRIRQRDPALRTGELALRAEAMESELIAGQETADAIIVNDRPIGTVVEELRGVLYGFLNRTVEP